MVDLFRQEISADLTLISSTYSRVQLFRHLESDTELCCAENGYGLINGTATAFGSVKTGLKYVAVPRAAMQCSPGTVWDDITMSRQIIDDLLHEFDDCATEGENPVNILKVGMIAYSNIKNIARNQGGLSSSVLKGNFNDKTKVG